MSHRFKLNSINYGEQFLGLVGLFGIAIPAGLYVVEQGLALFGLRLSWLRSVLCGSAAIGIGLLVVFALLLTIEFTQDAYLNRQYRRTQNRKLKIADGIYECQYCGYRTVKANNRQCPVCGKELV